MMNRWSAITNAIDDALSYTNPKNTKYPDEDFDDFIVRMIENKKEIIERIVSF